MRTTLDLDDQLYLRLKRQAKARNSTLTREIEETLARGLRDDAPVLNQAHRFAVFADAPRLPVDIANREALETWLEGEAED